MNAPASITITPVRVADLLAEGERMPVYVHVIDHPDARVLVDTGLTELHPAVADLDPRLRPLSKQDFDLAGIDIVVNTHLHFDHCGGNHLFAGRPIYVQRRELDDARRESTHARLGPAAPSTIEPPVVPPVWRGVFCAHSGCLARARFSKGEGRRHRHPFASRAGHSMIFLALPSSSRICNPVSARSTMYTKPRSSVATLFVWMTCRQTLGTPLSVPHRRSVARVVLGMKEATSVGL